MDQLHWIYPTVTLISELMTNNESHGNMFSPPIEKQHEVESCEFAVRSLHLGFGNRAGRKQLRCCAVLVLPLHLRCIATPRPTLHWSASPPASAMAGPSSTAKLVPARNKS